MSSIVYSQESYNIIGAAMQVYNVLGIGFLESVYQEALSIEFQKRGIPYEKEKELTIEYEGIKLEKKFYADFVCYDKIIIELKAVSKLDKAHKAQVYNYLHATGYKLGILLNFGADYGLERDRIVL